MRSENRICNTIPWLIPWLIPYCKHIDSIRILIQVTPYPVIPRRTLAAHTVRGHSFTPTNHSGLALPPSALGSAISPEDRKKKPSRACRRLTHEATVVPVSAIYKGAHAITLNHVSAEARGRGLRESSGRLSSSSRVKHENHSSTVAQTRTRLATVPLEIRASQISATWVPVCLAKSRCDLPACPNQLLWALR